MSELKNSIFELVIALVLCTIVLFGSFTLFNIGYDWEADERAKVYEEYHESYDMVINNISISIINNPLTGSTGYSSDVWNTLIITGLEQNTSYRLDFNGVYSVGNEKIENKIFTTTNTTKTLKIRHPTTYTVKLTIYQRINDNNGTYENIIFNEDVCVPESKLYPTNIHIWFLSVFCWLAHWIAGIVFLISLFLLLQELWIRSKRFIKLIKPTRKVKPCCSNCNEKLGPSAKFCPKCGQTVKSQVSSSIYDSTGEEIGRDYISTTGCYTVTSSNSFDGVATTYGGCVPENAPLPVEEKPTYSISDCQICKKEIRTVGTNPQVLCDNCKDAIKDFKELNPTRYLCIECENGYYTTASVSGFCSCKCRHKYDITKKEEKQEEIEKNCITCKHSSNNTGISCFDSSEERWNDCDDGSLWQPIEEVKSLDKFLEVENDEFNGLDKDNTCYYHWNAYYNNQELGDLCFKAWRKAGGSSGDLKCGGSRDEGKDSSVPCFVSINNYQNCKECKYHNIINGTGKCEICKFTKKDFKVQVHKNVPIIVPKEPVKCIYEKDVTKCMQSWKKAGGINPYCNGPSTVDRIIPNQDKAPCYTTKEPEEKTTKPDNSDKLCLLCKHKKVDVIDYPCNKCKYTTPRDYTRPLWEPKEAEEAVEAKEPKAEVKDCETCLYKLKRKNGTSIRNFDGEDECYAAWDAVKDANGNPEDDQGNYRCHCPIEEEFKKIECLYLFECELLNGKMFNTYFISDEVYKTLTFGDKVKIDNTNGVVKNISRTGFISNYKVTIEVI